MDRQDQVPRHDDPKGERSFRSAMAQAARYSELAFIIPAGIIVGYLLGAGLDRWLHTQWGTIAGVIVGVAAGFIQMIRRVLALSKQ